MNYSSTTADKINPSAPKLPIARHRINGKRRMVLSTDDLAQMTHTSVSALHDIIRRIPFRKYIDFVYHDETYLLTLSSSQTVLAVINTEQGWQNYHQITDFLQQISNRNAKQRKEKEHNNDDI